MTREVIRADAVPWMTTARGTLGDRVGVVTSLPDAAEVGLSVEAWRAWFDVAAGLAMMLPTPTAAAVFYQTDRKADGELVSKAGMLLAAAARVGCRLLWHKIVLRRGVGRVDLHRPGFSHMMAFSRAGRPGPATPDVLEAGLMVYPNAMGSSAAAVAVEFVGRAADLVVDPFCGRGSVLLAAERAGLNALGVDIDPEQCERARALR